MRGRGSAASRAKAKRRKSLETILAEAIERERARVGATMSEAEFEQLTSEAIVTAAGKTAGEIVESLRKEYPALQKWRADLDDSTVAAVSREWGDPLGKLDAIHHSMAEFGSEVIQRLNPKSSHLAQALILLLGRAARVGGEICLLLRHGYPDGAQARWRTLHEVAVVVWVLAEYGEECAEKYLLHADVQECRMARQYAEDAEALGRPPINRVYMEGLEGRRRSLVSRFGKAFGTDYGWATGIGGVTVPRLKDLEAAVEMRGFRELVGEASSHVHAGADGLHPTGVPNHGANVVLLGASQTGLAEAGGNTAVTMVQVVAGLYSANPSIEHGLWVKAMAIMSKECGDSFTQAEATEGRVAGRMKRVLGLRMPKPRRSR